MKMTSRERVLRGIEGKSVDRAPMEFGGFISGIVEGSKNTIAQGPPYGIRALYEYCGIEGYEEPVIAPSLSCVTNLDNRLYQRLNSDIVHAFGGGHPTEILPNGLLKDPWGIIMKPDGFYSSVPDPLTPLHDATSISDIKNYPDFPDPTDPIFLKGILEMAQNYHLNTDKAVQFFPGYPSLIFHTYAWLRGFDKWLTDMYTNKKFYTYLADKITELAIEISRNMLIECGRNIDIVLYGDDMGMQTQALMSADVYRKMVKPWSKKWCDEAKKRHLT